MKITLLGATGPTGQRILGQALEAGHEVTALVRDPERLPQREDPRVTVVTGDATRVEDVRTALAGADVLLSALGPGKNLKSDIASRAGRAIVAAADATGVTRVVILSALGAGETEPYIGTVPKIVIRLLMSKLFADKTVADAGYRASDLDWTLVYPAILTNRPATGAYDAVQKPDRKISDRISRADVADFMLRAAGGDEWSCRGAVLVKRK